MVIAPIQPRQVRLELTNQCNAHCLPCHRNTMKREQGFIERRLVEKCLEDVKGFPQTLEEIVPANYGELFIHPHWAELLHLIARELPKTRMVIPTNGTLLRDGTVEKLAEIPTLRLVNVSVNAFLPVTYQTFHRLPARLTGEIENSVKQLKSIRPDVTLWISMTHDSQYQSPKEVELFTQHWSQYGTVQINTAQYNNRPERQPLTPVVLSCRSLWSDLVVLWDGKVTSCCYDAEGELYVGDANRESLLDIWHSKQFAHLRQLHKAARRATIPICKRCTFA